MVIGNLSNLNVTTLNVDDLHSGSISVINNLISKFINTDSIHSYNNSTSLVSLGQLVIGNLSNLNVTLLNVEDLHSVNISAKNTLSSLIINTDNILSVDNLTTLLSSGHLIIKNISSLEVSKLTVQNITVNEKLIQHLYKLMK